MPRGGFRKGSGRPLKYGRPTVSVTCDLPRDLVEEIDAIANAANASRTYTLMVLLSKQLGEQ